MKPRSLLLVLALSIFIIATLQPCQALASQSNAKSNVIPMTHVKEYDNNEEGMDDNHMGDEGMEEFNIYSTIRTMWSSFRTEATKASVILQNIYSLNTKTSDSSDIQPMKTREQNDIGKIGKRLKKRETTPENGTLSLSLSLPFDSTATTTPTANNTLEEVSEEDDDLWMLDCSPGFAVNTNTTKVYDCQSFLVTQDQFIATKDRNVLCSDCAAGNSTCLGVCCNPVPSNQIVCLCPASHMGTECEIFRSRICEITLLSPDLSCSSPSSSLASSTSNTNTNNECTYFKTTEIAKLTFGVDCYNPVEPWVSGYLKPNNQSEGQNEIWTDGVFSYYYYNGRQIALYFDPQQSLRFQIHNFIQWSADDGVINVPLTPEVLQNGIFTVDVDVPKLVKTRVGTTKSKYTYLVGGRMYAEMRLRRNLVNFTSNTWRSFLDFSDIQTELNVASAFGAIGSSGGAIGGIVVAVICVPVGAFAVWWNKKRRRNKDRVRDE